jgi:hypothetical protein
MEYSLSGLPYVSIDHALSEELNGQFGHVSFFKIHDHRQLANALKTTIDNITQPRQNASKVKNKISWSSEMTPEILKYQELIGSRKRI